MKKDPRISQIKRSNWGDTFLYALALMMIGPLVFADSMDGGAAPYVIIAAMVMASARIRIEIREIRLDAIKRDNVLRAERNGLALPWMYAEVDDLQEALRELQAKPPSPPNPPIYKGGTKTTVCPTCAHCMAIPPDYSRNEAKCGACGHIYKL